MPEQNLVSLIKEDISIKLITISVVIIFGGVIAALIKKDASENIKKILYLVISLPIIITTLFLTISTIYLNNISDSGGPVHYHADFEIWKCGQELELVDPVGLSNKIGQPVIHEHNDKRIHAEGVLMDLKEVSLGHFFKVVGGKLDKNGLFFPAKSGVENLANGESCGYGNMAFLQTFVYSTNKEGFYTQIRIENPVDYVINPYSTIPPGDCVIFEYDSVVKEKTDKMCQSYKVAKELGKIKELK